MCLQNSKLGQDAVASATGSFISATMMTPLDVVKVRYQASSPTLTSKFAKNFSKLNSNKQQSSAPLHSNTRGYRCARVLPSVNLSTSQGDVMLEQPNLFRSMCLIRRAEGVRGLFSGLSPALLMTVPSTIVYFTLYDRLKVVFGFIPNDSSTTHRAAVAGTVSRLITVSVVNPLELVKTILQSEKISFRRLRSIISSSISETGYRSLWRGLGFTITRDIPFSFIYWFTLERLKQASSGFFLPSCSGLTPTQAMIFQNIVCAAAGGILAASFTLPFDVLKTIDQVSMKSNADSVRKTSKISFKVAGKRKGLNRLHAFHLAKNLVKERGFRSLWSGLTPRLIKVTPSSIIMITTFEYLKYVFRDMEKKK